MRDLPAGWQTAKLDDLVSISGGGTPSKSNAAFWAGGDIPWVSPKDMKSLWIDDAQDHITVAAVRGSSTSLNEAGAVLMVIRSGILQHSLPMGINRVAVAVNQDLKVLRPAYGLTPEFLLNSLRAAEHAVLQTCCKDGTTVQSIEIPSLREFEVAVAPAAEQHRIVARLDELFSELDAGVAALERVRLKLPRYRAALLHAAVTGELTRDWRAAHPTADGEDADALLRDVLEARRADWERRTREKYEADGKKPPKGWEQRYRQGTGVDDLDGLPRSWTTASIDQLCGTITSGSRAWKQYYGRGTGTFIMAANVRMGRLDLTDRQAVDPPANSRDCVRSQVEVGDLLVTIVGANTGDVCKVEEELPEHYVCQSVALMRSPLPVLADWVQLFLVAPTGGQRQFDTFTYGAGRPHLGFDHLQQTAISLPPLAEQAEIMSRAAEKLSQIDAMQTEVDRGLRRAERLRQSILKAAFEGRLVPQDPADEPASALLARIAADRAAS